MAQPAGREHGARRNDALLLEISQSVLPCQAIEKGMGVIPSQINTIIDTYVSIFCNILYFCCTDSDIQRCKNFNSKVKSFGNHKV